MDILVAPLRPKYTLPAEVMPGVPWPPRAAKGLTMTDARIDEIAGPADYWDRRVFARAIESAATAPLLERIAELESKFAQQAQNEQKAPMASTIEEAARDVAKCLNERGGHGLDLRHVAMLVHHAHQADAPAWNALVSDREYLRLFDEARHGSTGGFGVLRGIRACIAAYEAATPAQQAEAQEPCA